MLLLLACTPLGPVATDGQPARRTKSPTGAWEALVDEEGSLRVRPFGDESRAASIATRVDRRVAFSPDERTLVFSQDSGLGELDLWRVSLPGGTPERLTDWLGTEDRPVLSPDGRTLAFVGSPEGIPGWWTMDLANGVFTQTTNIGVRGREGFVPVPEGSHYSWGAEGLSWVAEGRAHSVVPR